jgi:succinate dehydrogenase/fumarate reductase flavoprotein subunit
VAEQARVVVLGGGMAGLCAAMAASGAGADVVVLEEAPCVGGSMALSGGLLWGPKDLATARSYIPKGRADLQAKLCEELPSAWEWLEQLGLPLGDESPCLKDDVGRGRLMGLGASGSRGDFAAAMENVLRAGGGAVRTGVNVVGLRATGKGWLVDVLHGGGREAIECGSLISATGGFQNNRDMLRRYVTAEADRLIVRSNRQSAGGGIGLLQAQGAGLSNGMSSFYGHSLPYTPGREIASRDFIPASQYYSDYTVILNRLGLRFTDESIGVLDEHNAQQGSRQPGARYFLVFDEAIRNRHVASSVGLPGVLGSQVPDRLDLVRSLGGLVVEASSLRGLADALGSHGVPPENVRDSIDHYNAATDPVRGLFPPRIRHREPLREAPFYAVECVSAITYTMGGLLVDDECRVLDTAGRQIGSAFAAGADAGGVFQDVYGGGLGWAAVSGRAAGLGAAS